jgi:Putative auto-transporter adhesin, head GIN domain
MLSFKQLRQMMQLQGNGTLGVRTHQVSSFTRLHLCVQGTLELHQGTEEKVVVETDENLLDFVGVVNSGHTLFVNTANKLRHPVYSQLRVAVYLRQLQHLDIANYLHSSVVCSKPLCAIEPLDIKIRSIGDTQLLLQADVLNLHCASQGRVTVAGTAGQVLINNKSEGELDCRDLAAQHLKLFNMGVGNVQVRAEQTIRIQHKGVGNVHYSGSGRLLDVQQYGMGEVKHVD